MISDNLSFINTVNDKSLTEYINTNTITFYVCPKCESTHIVRNGHYMRKITHLDDVDKDFYSFASKYCSHHEPFLFLIYDYYVNKILRYFRNRGGLANISNSDLTNYRKYKDVLISSKNYYGLDKYNFKQIDRYLWQIGKEYFPKKCKRK